MTLGISEMLTHLFVLVLLCLWSMTLWRAYRWGYRRGRIEQQDRELRRRKRELERLINMVQSFLVTGAEE